MGILDLIDHVLAHVGNDDLAASRGVGNGLLGALNGPLLHLVVLNAILDGCLWRCCRRLLAGTGRRRWCCSALCLCSLSALVNLLVSALLVLVEVLHKLPHSRDWVVPGVVAARAVLLLRHGSAVRW